MAGKIPLDQPEGGGADEHRIGRRQALEPGRNVGGVPKGELLLPCPPAHGAHDDQARVDAQPEGEAGAMVAGQAGVEGAERLDHPKPGAHGPLGIVLMRPGVAEVDQQPVAERLDDVAVKLPDHLGAGLLIGLDHFAQVFRVELTRQGGRVDEVAKQHRELAALGFHVLRRRLLADRRRGCRSSTSAPGCSPPTAFSPRIFTGNAPGKASTFMQEAIEAVLTRKTTAEWYELLVAAGVPCGPVYRYDQVFHDPHVQHRQMAVEMEHQQAGRLTVTSTPLKLSRPPGSVRTPAPVLGQHTDTILHRLGYDEATIAQYHAEGVV